MEQGKTFKIDKILEDETGGLLQEVPPSVETGCNLEDRVLEGATIETGLSL